MKHFIIAILVLVSQFTFAQSFGETPQNPPLESIWRSSIAFADVDGDLDQDLVISGLAFSTGKPATILYKNDGNGNFTEVSGTQFVGIEDGSIGFSDVDGDSDFDLLITGAGDTSNHSILYANDGIGNFSEVMGLPFAPSYRSSIAFADIDADSDEDLIITGNSNGIATTKLFQNDTSTSFIEITGTSFENVEYGAVSFSDVDNDNDMDLLITGRNRSSSKPVAKLYTNNGIGVFTEVSPTPFDSVYYSAIAFADVDNDNDSDVLITGLMGSMQTSKLYTNDGNGNFTEAFGTPFTGVSYGSVAFADIDGDNDQDVLISGWTGSTAVTELFLNDGSGNFTIASNVQIDGVSNCSTGFADLNGNQKPDVCITGRNAGLASTTKIYINGAHTSIFEYGRNNAFELNLFPNPTALDYIQVEASLKNHGQLSIRIIDLYGRIILEQKETSTSGLQEFKIDITNLNSGSYLIQLNAPEGIATKEFIVK